ncbi:MAG: DUF4859 domain-containing protein [Bacteroides sp.]|nr:DUF4859 domain-containing protein [Roseburia sp.]MCM1347511.1 DUF4859 domain-containing protein [Bacteroides sp.]MCM1421964.1 DUF4859 domain-containing protein [Bacteroides sp.]
MTRLYPNRKNLLRTAMLLLGMTPSLTGTVRAENVSDSRVVYTFNITQPAEDSDTILCNLNYRMIGLRFGLSTKTEIKTALQDGTIKFYAIQSTGSYYKTSTASPYGHWFSASGNAVTATNKNAVVMGQFRTDKYAVAHIPSKVSEGNTYKFRQALVYDEKDTIEYVFNIKIGHSTEITHNQPTAEETFVHRKGYTEDWIVAPVVGRNEEELLSQNYIQVMQGDQITFGARTKNEGESVKILIKSPAGKTLRNWNAKDYVLENATPEHNGAYTVQCRLTDASGKVTVKSYYYFVDVQTEEPGTPYNWSEHTPYWSYDFRDEYPDGFPAPTKVLNTYGDRLAGYKADGWWCFQWGKNRHDFITDECIQNLLDKYNTDFAYIRDEMGWPPDIRAREGYYSTVVLHGSGLHDDTPQTELGGWQSAGYYEGRSWPMVLASYYPVYSFDENCPYADAEAQREAMIHEGIHALFADMDGVKNAAWFHEGGNTWLQSAMAAKRSGEYGIPGFLDACPFIAPFMPIECYSGWLQDGSFGGPSAEGVNMFEGSQQICTWRTLLGGTQYGNGFPTFLGEVVGQGAVPWIWRYCKSRVLEGIADTIGEEAIRSLILQYRAKQATFDIGGWKQGYRTVMNNNFGSVIKSEWEPYWIDCKPYTLSPYASMFRNSEDGWYVPDTLTTPGWSGSNIIPIHVEGDVCEVEFSPNDPGMRAQLCYTTPDDKCYYSQPVHCGKMTIDITDKPANGVIFCVVANTDYIYVNDDTRKKHFNYSVKLGTNCIDVASRDCRWYFNEQTIVDNEYNDFREYATGIRDVAYNESENMAFNGVRLLSGTLRSGDRLQIDLNGHKASDITVRILGMSGLLVEAGKLDAGSYTLPSSMTPGMYFITFTYGDKRDVYKVFVR